MSTTGGRPMGDGIGMRLRELRAAAGLSRDEAAERAGLPASTLTKYELTGVVPPVTVAAKIARVYGVPMEALIEPPSPDFVPPPVGRPKKAPPAEAAPSPKAKTPAKKVSRGKKGGS